MLMKDVDPVGHDGVLSSVLQQCEATLEWPLEMLGEYSLEEGSLPWQWNRAGVVIAFKINNRTTRS